MMSRRVLALSLAVCGGSFVLTNATAHSVFVAPAPQVHITAGRQSFRASSDRTESFGRIKMLAKTMS